MFRTSTSLFMVAAVHLIVIQPSGQYFFNGIKSGLDEDLKNSLFLSHIGQCRWQQDLSVFLGDMRIVQRSNTQYVVSGVFVVRRNLTGPIATAVKIEICQNETHCRPFVEPPVAVGDVCDFLRHKQNTSLGAILSYGIPPLVCPLQKGLYRVNDALVDYKPFR
ncbi:AGAP005493-PA-like protein [Anopheles sinensis]|uniref:AGAP005493-PA-like protein n=1 Tax=Anopheles sinensis TaxID=74873 RepID=A0A084W2X7_ANOSI|nr:AGAP005493-PA-like protein [Anopheles sinensis]